MQVTKLSDLVPGQLYVCAWTRDIHSAEPLPETDYGQLVWFASDGRFYFDGDDATEDTNAHLADFWVPQIGCFDPEYKTF